MCECKAFMDFLKKAYDSICTKFCKNQESKATIEDVRENCESSVVDVPTEEDKFGFCEKIVRNIQILLDRNIKPLIIAVTGPWGSGKSSTLKILKKELYSRSDYKIIEFDPIIECKFEVKELLESFLVKLLSSISINQDDFRDLIKRLLKTLLLLRPSEFSLPTPRGSLRWNLDARVEEFIKIWQQNCPNEFSSQIKKLDMKINNAKLKPIIFIDEIDRLPAEEIIKFLIFARVLEVMSCVRCIIAFDYERVLCKLKHFLTSNPGGTEGEALSASYLEKFFQARYEVSASLHNHHLKSYAVNISMKYQIDLRPQIMDSNLSEIMSLLEHPRNVKRWIVELLRIKGLLKSEEYFSFWLNLTALFIKYPIALADFRKRKEFLKDDEIIRGLSKNIKDSLLKVVPKSYIVLNRFAVAAISQQ